MRNRTRGRVTLPMVIRIPYGGGIGGVEHHSDSSEAYYAHTPGLHVVTPSTVADAYGLLRAAIASPDPVVFLEPKKLYCSKEEVSIGDGVPPIGTAVVCREGTDATLIAYGPAVPVALDAAAVAAQEGRSLQVVDLRCIVPFDDETVCRAVRSTGRAVVVSEASGFASVSSEIVARVTERCFHSLAAPIRRVTGLDIPYPPPRYEAFHLPSVDRVLDAVDALQWEDA
jgi:pyruvate dehydrogenase E1 component beta subunit